MYILHYIQSTFNTCYRIIRPCRISRSTKNEKGKKKKKKKQKTLYCMWMCLWILATTLASFHTALYCVYSIISQRLMWEREATWECVTRKLRLFMRELGRAGNELFEKFKVANTTAKMRPCLQTHINYVTHLVLNPNLYD